MSVYENVDYDGLLAKMDQKSFVIDVRERHELAATGSLPNSINVPLGELENDLNLSAEVFEKKYQVPKPDKDNSEIVFSCARGNRSRRAAEIAFKLNYKKSNALFLASGQMYVYQYSNISKLLMKCK